jgi:hypothetical protein
MARKRVDHREGLEFGLYKLGKMICMRKNNGAGGIYDICNTADVSYSHLTSPIMSNSS